MADLFHRVGDPKPDEPHHATAIAHLIATAWEIDWELGRTTPESLREAGDICTELADRMVAQYKRHVGLPFVVGDDDLAEAAATAPRAAGRTYSRDNGEVLKVASRWVKDNATASKAALLTFLEPRRDRVGDQLGAALDAAVDPYCARDAVGTFTNPLAIARALDEAGKGVQSP